MKLPSAGAAALLILLLPGCASVIKGTRKGVHVTSEPPGALIKIDGATRALTPATVYPAMGVEHRLSVELPGYEPYSLELRSRRTGWVWANAGTGFLPGLAFDEATGASRRFNPAVIDVQLQKLPGAQRGGLSR